MSFPLKLSVEPHAKPPDCRVLRGFALGRLRGLDRVDDVVVVDDYRGVVSVVTAGEVD
jgi:hypothetical protein